MIFSFLFIIPLLANDFQKNILTVQNAFEIAKLNNPQMNQIREEINFKKGEFWTSTSLNDPTFSLMKEGIDLDTNSGFSEKSWAVTQSFDFH